MPFGHLVLLGAIQCSDPRRRVPIDVGGRRMSPRLSLRPLIEIGANVKAASRMVSSLVFAVTKTMCLHKDLAAAGSEPRFSRQELAAAVAMSYRHTPAALGSQGRKTSTYSSRCTRRFTAPAAWRSVRSQDLLARGFDPNVLTPARLCCELSGGGCVFRRPPLVSVRPS